MSQPRTHKTRLQADSVPAIKDALDDLATAHAREGLKFQKRGVEPGPLLNAIVLRFLAQSQEEIDRQVPEIVADLRRLVAGEIDLAGLRAELANRAAIPIKGPAITDQMRLVSPEAKATSRSHRRRSS